VRRTSHGTGRCRPPRGLAGRAGPVARPLARHKQSTGLFVSGLGPSNRLRATAGQKVLTVQGAMPRELGSKQDLCADINGFSLHAAARCAADDRQALEQLCRYITRPALANERLHLIRFHGVLAPNAKLRAQVVPQEPVAPARAAQPAACDASCAHHGPVRLSWARLLKRVFSCDIT